VNRTPFAFGILGITVLLGAVFVFNAHVVRGQEPKSPSLRGRVIDQAGRPVPGAALSLRALSRQTTGASNLLTTLSAVNGTFSFLRMEIGTDYELSAEHNGSSSPTRSLRISNPDERVTLDLVLAPAIRFENIAGSAGLDFVVRNAASGNAYQPEIMLGGVAALDYNNDGCMDIFLVNGAALPSLVKTGPEFYNRLYRNNCNSTFTDVTKEAGVTGSGYSMGVAVGDFDNDGFADFFVTGVNRNTLYHNNGNGTFTDITDRAGLGRSDPKYGPMWSISAGWVDYDGDGFLDLFVANYVAWTPKLDATCRTRGESFYCHPRVYPGLPNQLYHNNRNGTFTDVSEISGVRASVGKGMGVVFGDYNGDGLPDIFVANDSVPNFLFRNLGNGKFKESALEVGVALLANGNAVASMGADFRDVDDDGLDDVAVNAMYFDTFPFFHNAGSPNFFEDRTASSGVALATRNLTGWGMGMMDFDNDGQKDLFYATSHFPGSEPFVHSPSAISNHVLRNRGNGFFDDVSLLAGDDFQSPALYHGAAFADFDNDGRLDVVVTALNTPAKLFRNVSPGHAHWLALRLTGTQSNRDGLGARVRVTLPTGAVKYNHATTSVGYASSSEPLIRFGLGPYDFASEIQIQWPSRKIQTLRNVKANQVVSVREE
jgi:enediyne biosynthesis protein E4